MGFFIGFSGARVRNTDVHVEASKRLITIHYMLRLLHNYIVAVNLTSSRTLPHIRVRVYVLPLFFVVYQSLIALRGILPTNQTGAIRDLSTRHFDLDTP